MILLLTSAPPLLSLEPHHSTDLFAFRWISRLKRVASSLGRFFLEKPQNHIRRLCRYCHDIKILQQLPYYIIHIQTHSSYSTDFETRVAPIIIASGYIIYILILLQLLWLCTTNRLINGIICAHGRRRVSCRYKKFDEVSMPNVTAINCCRLYSICIVFCVK